MTRLNQAWQALMGRPQIVGLWREVFMARINQSHHLFQALNDANAAIGEYAELLDKIAKGKRT